MKIQIRDALSPSAGDRALHIEKADGRLFMLAGETVHRGMIDHLPGH